jgi:hypothetical protein
VESEEHWALSVTLVHRIAKPYECIGFWAIDVTKPYEFIRFGPQILKIRYKNHLGAKPGANSQTPKLGG